MTTEMSGPIEIADCLVVREGDRVEGRRHGTVYHRGTIQDLMPAMGLFWIIDSRTGTRKLLDMTEYRIWALPAH